jgi:multidrug efflux pump subunit AcrA (membrane-fusion protein)
MSDASSERREFRAPALVRMPWRRRLEAVVRGPVQVVVWLAFGLLAVWLAGRGPGVGPMRGLVRAPEAAVCAMRDGRLVELLVREGDLVEAGVVVARLDSDDHDAALESAQGDVDVLAAELVAAKAEEALAELELALASEDRRLRADEAALRAGLDAAANELRLGDRAAQLSSELRESRLAVATLDVAIASGRVALARIRQQEARVAALASSGIDRRASAEDLALDVAELEAELAGNEALRAAEEVAANEARLELEAAVDSASVGAPPLLEITALGDGLAARAAAAGRARVRAIERALAVAEATVERLSASRIGLDLVAPISGRVVSVDAWPGAALVAGAVALVVRSEVATDAVVYLDEVAAATPPRMVTLARAADPRRAATARVVRLGAGVEELPLALRRLPTQPEFGRPVVVELPAELQLLPGERLRASVAMSASLPKQP